MFVKTPATKRSISLRRSVYGIGINDANYSIRTPLNGKFSMCPAYRKWQGMLERCYSEKYLSKKPTYRECTVCTEWLTFSNFAKWFDANNIEGYELDKDIKIKGNKIYSPDSCLFVHKSINGLLNDHGNNRGAYPQGVTLHNSKLRARINIDGKQSHIGYFPSEDSASKAYIKAKNEEILRKCEKYPELSKYLINHLK